jgi:hypothetical protein
MISSAVTLDQAEPDQADREPERDLADEGRGHDQPERQEQQHQRRAPAARKGPPSMVSRGFEKRSSRISGGKARPTARAPGPSGRCCGSEQPLRQPGRGAPAISICAATKASTRPQTSGIGGGIGRQFGRPSSTTSSA